MSSDDSYSEEEIFFGPMTLDEIKKRFLPRSCRQTVGTRFGPGDKNVRCSSISNTQYDHNISSESMPSLVKRGASSSICLSYETTFSKDVTDTDDSFLHTEKIVEDICKNHEVSQLNNTQEILKYVSNKKHKDENLNSKENKPVSNVEVNSVCQSQQVMDNTLKMDNTPLESAVSTIKINATPNKDHKMGQLKKTPCSNMKSKTPLFKTPGIPASHKLLGVSHAWPTAKKQFDHVMSPVASYIHDRPPATPTTNVHPKVFTGPSHIPKLVKSIPRTAKCGKENVSLPAMAYRPAKEIKEATNPEENKLPHSERAKQVSSSIPKAIVLKHSNKFS